MPPLVAAARAAHRRSPTGEKLIAAAVFRRAWFNLDLSMADVGAELGLSRSSLWRRANRLGLPDRTALRRARRAEKLRQVLVDDRRHNADIAAEIGVSSRHLAALVREVGLPRRLGPKIVWDQARFVALYTRGVALSELAVHFGRDRSTLCHHVKRLGLPPRGNGWQPSVTLAQVSEEELAARMAFDRAAERLRIKLMAAASRAQYLRGEAA